jgi:hypothetical protein
MFVLLRTEFGRIWQPTNTASQADETIEYVCWSTISSTNTASLADETIEYVCWSTISSTCRIFLLLFFNRRLYLAHCMG